MATEVARSVTPTPMSSKRTSQHRRKQPPALEPVPISLDALDDLRYPPFDMEDPFASLLELRRRCFSYSCDLKQSSTTDHGSPAADTAPFDLPSKAFPSGTNRRYTLSVALPTSFYSFDAESEPTSVQMPTIVPAPASARRPSLLGSDDRSAALQTLTKNSETRDDRSATPVGTRSETSSDSAGRGAGTDGKGGDHHKRYSHIASFFEGAGASQKTVRTSKSHYLPRKLSSMGYMQTPPLTPDVSGSSLDATSSPLPSPQASTFAEKDAALREKRSPSPSAASLMRKLLPRRSTTDLLPKKRQLDAAALEFKDLPPLPRSTTPASMTRRQEGLAIPFPMSLPNRSDISLTPTLHDMPSDPFRSMSPLSMQTSRPEAWTVPGAELDAGLTYSPTSAKRNKFFTLGSRSFQRSRTDLREFGEKTRSASRLGYMAVAPDDNALPTHEQLKLAASVPVVAESGVRIPFGDLCERGQTLVVFIRHFRSTTSQEFVRSISTDVDVDTLAKVGLKIIIIGLGSHTLIAPYRRLTGARSIPIYTDPTLSLHRTLGLKSKTGMRAYASEQNLSETANTFSGIRRAMSRRLALPLFERAGDSAPLGGEFIFVPGLTCTYARRMIPKSGSTSRAHTPILDIVAVTGIQTPMERRVTRAVRRREKALYSSDERRDSMADEDAWMAARRRSLTRLRRKRQCRRVAGVEAATAFNYSQRLPPSPVKESNFAVVEEELEDDVKDVTNLETDATV